MNEKLKILMDLIQKSETLKDKERNALLEELKAAEKDFEITSFKLERTEKVKKTTAILLEETIEELEQKRKAVESQNRELEIEAALERIRTHNMAMQDSSELAETASVFFKEFKDLGLLPTEARTYFSFIDSKTDSASVWMTQADGSVRPGTHNVPLNDSPQLKKVYNAWKQKEPLIIRNMSGKVLDEYISFVSTLPHVEKDDALKKLLSLSPKRIVMTEATFRYGTIGIMTNELLSEETQNTLTKFAKVFEQTYARFLDLKNAEARTREAQIEAALEKVRSSALAMTEPADMVEVCRIVSDQLQLLGIKDIRNVQTVVIYEQKGTYLNYQYFTAYKKNAIEEAEYKKHPSANRMAQEMKKSVEAFYSESFSGEELNVFREYRNSDNQFPDPIMDKTTAVHFYFFSIGMGALGISTYDNELSENDVSLFKRFRNVFELAYRRFVDIENALAQAREARIETALEKVRNRSLAMHKAEELGEVATVVFEKLRELSIPVDDGVALVSHIEGSRDQIEWMENPGYPSAIKVYMTYFDHPILSDYWKAKNEGLDFIVRKYTAEENKSFLNHIFEFSDYKNAPQEIKDYCLAAESYSYTAAFQKNSSIFINDYSGKPLSEKEIDIVKRFSKVFEQAYVRFLDLQKAELQAREAKIEASLEIVRSLALGMHKSDEVGSVTDRLFEELNKLTMKAIGCTIVVIDENKDRWETWRARTKMAIKPFETASYKRTIEVVKKNIPEWFSEFYESLGSKNKRLITEMSGERRIQMLNSIAEQYEYSKKERARLLRITPEEFTAHYLFFKLGYLALITEERLPEENLAVTRRFVEVFDFAYTRFLDIKRAEEQARESEIQLALERVRARTMAMQHSSELSETASIFFKQLSSLGIETNRLYIGIFNDDSGIMHAWATSEEGSTVSSEFFLDSKKSISVKKMYDGWKGQKKSIVIDMQGKELSDYIRYLSEEVHVPVTTGYSQQRRVQDIAYFSKGLIGLASPEPQPDENIDLLERFAKVFDQTYTRFLDLQKAEAQAREAQIEAALERVRSRTMGMQKSEELKEVIQLVYEQLVHLNIQTEHTGFILDYKTRDDLHIWLADQREIPSEITIPCFDSPPNNSIKEAKEKGENFFTYLLTFEEKNKFYQDLFKYIPGVPDESLEYYFKCPGLAGSGVLLENIGLYIENFSGIPYTDEENKTLMRFGKVFQQTYTRFLDLQKAEAQAREAQIEAALERVRSRTMAMQQSNELAETAADFFIQLNNLGIKPYRCSIAIVDEQDDKCQLWSTTNEGKVIPIGTFIPLYENDVINQMYEGWKEQQHRIIKIIGEARIKWTEYIRKYVPFAEYMPENIDIEKLKSEPAILSNFYFKQGFFVIHTSEEVDDSDLKIVQRFANVFEQTYTRFLDLKKAEAQAKEAIKQASLDRVRAEIASMRTADDLNRITPIIWHELKSMEIPFIRCGLYIIDEEKEQVQVYLTTPDGMALGVLNLAFDVNEMTRNTVDHWRKEKVYKEFWDKQGFINWTNSMIELGQVQDAETYQGSTNPPESLHLHFVPFSQGMLYVGDVSPLTEDKLELVKSLAEAFSIAYARYEDFQNLEAAKNRIETTLSELKSTQAQLVHAEKMASLGELTAGIAHEIKNPLNFVNNFSEVSRELLAEMKIELENNNLNEVIEMVEDLKQNLEKINHHGKRADLIIKSMLLHSRGSSGEKVLTNINELLDQYVVLSYHGMRAQNKEFNISIEKDYDESIPRINVVPQDISRVFLNIVNNACYATHEKKKNEGNNYSPLLKVSTKNLRDKTEIRIKDNGNGIPAELMDKIFQPFFTTKPTGEGTGLGLSLSYDIVTKLHNGELKVETKEGVGTEFIIILKN